MLLALDESGDRGLKVLSGQSPWLVVAAARFADRESAFAGRAAVNELRTKLGVGEFRFADNSKAVHRAMLGLMAGLPFTYHAVVCDRSRTNLKRWESSDRLYHHLVGVLLRRLAPEVRNCTVLFDRQSGQDADRALKAHIRKTLGLCDGKPRAADCKPVAAVKEPCAQIADYVCGAVARSYRDRLPTDGEHRRLIAGREGWVEVWPPVG